MGQNFANTPYFGQSDNFSTFGGCPKLNFLKIPELWKATKYAKIIALTKVRGVLKTSFQWLLNGIKQKNPKVLVDCLIKA